MIILIIAGVFIIGIVIFKLLDRDFILCTSIDASRNLYHLKFESGKEADCVLINECIINDGTHSLFIPKSTLLAGTVPGEDIIILKKIKGDSNKSFYIFTDDDSYDKMYKLSLNKIEKAENIYSLLRRKK